MGVVPTARREGQRHSAPSPSIRRSPTFQKNGTLHSARHDEARSSQDVAALPPPRTKPVETTNQAHRKHSVQLRLFLTGQ